MKRGAAFVIVLFFALVGFDFFNFSATKYSLETFLGGHEIFGLGWATLLAAAFAVADVAGLFSVYTPEKLSEEKKETYFLFGAWAMAAVLNACFTWWGMLTAMTEQNIQGNAILSQEDILTYVPAAIAVMVLLIRVLLVGAITLAGDAILHGAIKFPSRKKGGKPSFSNNAPNNANLPVPPQDRVFRPKVEPK